MATIVEEQLLNHPSTIIIAGPSKAGKSQFTMKLVKHIDQLCTVPPKQIIWYFSEFQSSYRELSNIPHLRFVQGPPKLAELRANANEPWLIILDDLMGTLKDKELSDIFTKGCHHWSLSVVFLVQNLFYGPRTSRINASYLILFKNPSDKLQVQSLARQIYPSQVRFFLDAFEEATKEPYSYLMIDLMQTCAEELRLRTNIFPGEITLVYTP